MIKMQRRVRTRKGFTLIEVVTTLFIVGLLVVLIYPNVFNIRKMAEKKQQTVLFNTLQNQVNMYRIAHNDTERQDITLSTLMNSGYLTSAQVQQMGRAHFEIKGDRVVVQGK